MEVTFVLSKAQLNKMRNGKGIIVNQSMISRSGGALSDYADQFEAGKNFLIDSGLAQSALNYGISKSKGNKKGKKIASSATDGLLTGLRSYNVSDTNNMTKNGKNALLTGAFGAYNSYKGNGFLDDMKSAGKSISKGVTKTANKAGKTIKGGVNNFVKTAKKQDWGGEINNIKNAIPPELMQFAIQAGLQSQGVDPTTAAASAGAVTGATYSYDFGEAPSKKQAVNASAGALSGGISGLSRSGGSMRRPSMKGTQEMKERMMRVRDGRGFKGSGFRND